MTKILMTDTQTLPILYTFRRCPYAMRARMALYQAGVTVELREVVLRDRPAQLYEIFEPGSVPALQLSDGTIMGESLDIMFWALEQHDPDGWLDNKDEALPLIEQIRQPDGAFKYALDRYKYPGRYPDEDCSGMRERGLEILKEWNERIERDGFLSGSKITIADIAIFPFVRQFAHTDLDWFNAQDVKPLQNWLEAHKDSDLFNAVMQKFPLWEEGQQPLIFGVHSLPA